MKTRDRIYLLALILLPILVYAPSLSGDFLWDDFQLINNPLIRDTDGLSRIWSGSEAIDYYPIYYSAFWLQWRLWGDGTTGYHAINLLFHILNGLLLWRLLARLGLRSAPLCALLFAIHPLNAATVGWVSEQKNTVSLFFALLSSLCFARWAGPRDWSMNRRYFLSLTFYALALLTKPAVIPLPLVFAAVLITWAMTAGYDARVTPWRKAAAALTPFFLLALCSALVTTWFQHNRAMEGDAARVISWAERLTLAGQAWWFYLGKSLWPLHHCMIYPKATLSTGLHWVWPWAGWTGVMAVAFLLWVRGRRSGQQFRNPSASLLVLLALLSFTLMLTPVLGFVDQGFNRFSYVAEHWTYPALPGVLLIVSEALASLMSLSRGGSAARLIRFGAVTLTTGIVGFCLVSTRAEARTYADAVVYYRKAAECNQDNIVAHHNLANELAARGDLAAALPHYRETLRIEPTFWRAHLAIGSLMLQQGDLSGASLEVKQALELAPDEPEAHFLAGLCCGMFGDHPAAARHFEITWNADPGNCEALFNMALALYQSGRQSEARTALEEVLRRQPDHERARQVLETKFR